jgi:hypothetical protein
MRFPRHSPLLPCLVVASILCLATASSPGINLSDFQQINGFSSPCTAAYNTPIPGCTADDFTGMNPCSAACISGLEEITALLNSACQGTEADPSTLIGKFFQGTGVNALCPNADNSSVPTTTPSMTSSSATSSSSLSLSIGTSSTSTLSLDSTTSPTASSAPSMTATGSLLSSSSSKVTYTVVSSSTSSSKPGPTTSTNPDAFGGPGTPFAISQSTHYTVHIACLLIMSFAWMLIF